MNPRTLSLPLAVLLTCLPALAQSPRLTMLGSNVNSDGRALPHASSAQNGILTASAPVSFNAGTLTIDGTAQNIGYPGGSQNFSSEMRIMVRNLNTGAQLTVGNLFSNFNLPWTTSSTSRTIGIAGLGTISADDTIEVRCFESYDQSLVDSRWNSLTLHFYPKPPATTGATAVDVVACPCPPILSDDSDIAISMGLFTTLGELVESDNGSGGGGSQISLDGLPPGEYYVCCVPGIDANFDDGFVGLPGGGATDDGILRLRQAGPPFFEQTLHNNEVTWHQLVIEDSRCASDLDGDGAVALSDLARILADFGRMRP